jgi:predicted ATPase
MLIMTTPLFLTSLQIRRFRAFEELEIERLGRVNLIIGKNNVGKTSLLEALWLYAYQGVPAIVWQILESRDEGQRPKTMMAVERAEPHDPAPIIRRLFCQPTSNKNGTIQIGPIGSPEQTLSIEVAWYVSRTDEDGSRKLVPVEPGFSETVDNLIPALKNRIGTQENIYRIDRVTPGILNERLRCVFVSANGVQAAMVSRLWDSISLTDLEEDVLAALRLIAPRVERVSLVEKRRSIRDAERIPIVKTSDTDDPVPLRSLGEGMNRLFGLALALVNAKEGVFLIDEIESGLHYSVQPDVWRLVFQVARRLNVQVFATTHSWDCITAFQQAAKEYEQDEGMLVRLTQKKGRIVADMFDEDDLEVVTREGIEVR